MFIVDKYSRTPIYEQLIDQVEKMVLMNLLKSGDMLPSVRQLSQEIEINPNTLQKAYTELDRRGICSAAPGTGRYIAPNAAENIKNSKFTGLDEIGRITEELLLAGADITRPLYSVIDAYNRYIKAQSINLKETDAYGLIPDDVKYNITEIIIKYTGRNVN